MDPAVNFVQAMPSGNQSAISPVATTAAADAIAAQDAEDTTKLDLRDLPIEIRLEIWRATLKPKYIRPGVQYSVPVAAHVNRESRDLFLSSYRPITLYFQDSSNKERRLRRFINPEIDSVIEEGGFEGRGSGCPDVLRVLHYDSANLIPFGRFGFHNPSSSYDTFLYDDVASWKCGSLYPNAKDIWTIIALNEDEWYESTFDRNENSIFGSETNRPWYSFRCWKETGKVKVTRLHWQDAKEVVQQTTINLRNPVDRQMTAVALSQHILHIQLVEDAKEVFDDGHGWLDVKPREDGEPQQATLYRALWRLAVTRAGLVLQARERDQSIQQLQVGPPVVLTRPKSWVERIWDGFATIAARPQPRQATPLLEEWP